MNLELFLTREKFLDDRTIGRLSVGDMWQCWTLEDTYRETVGIPVDQWKIHGKTAIPMGTYRIKLRDSPKFGQDVPWLTNVPGYSWVLIHAGNRPEDSEGCILVGNGFDQESGNITQSRGAQDILYNMIRAADIRNEEIWITIK